MGYIIFNMRRAVGKEYSAESQGITIESLLVRKSSEVIPRGYMIVKNENKVLRTEPTDSISRELLFIQKLEVGFPRESDLIYFEVYDASNDELKAKGKIMFKSCKNSNRIDLFDRNGQYFCELYFELNDGKKSPSPGNDSYEIRRDENLGNFRSSSNPNLFSKIRAMSESRLSRDTQMLGTSRRKKISILQRNNDIFAPTERRFMTYQDKQTDIISYSKLSTMKFANQISKQYYRGASFGKGEKTDFARAFKGNPGVGDYRLPSIFDRY